MARIENAERARIFGPPCNPKRHRVYVTPWGMKAVVHELVLERFAASCELAKRASQWSPRRVDSYNCRKIRGSSSHSIHSWAMAWDFFSTPPGVPPPGGVWTPDDGMTPSFAAAFQKFGFVWGDSFARKDVPHVEWAAGRPSPITPPPTSPPTKPQEDDVPKPTDFTSACVDPISGGFWEQTAEGGINARNGAPAHKNYKDYVSQVGSRTFLTLVPNGQGGFIQIATDGSHWNSKDWK